MPKNVVSVAKHYIWTVKLMSNLYFDLLGQSCEEFCLRHGKTSNKKRATCFSLLPQNELNGDVERFTTHVQTCYLLRDRFYLGGKTRNIAIQLVLSQCCKTSCTFLVTRFSAPLPGADPGGGCRGCAPPPPWDDLQFSDTTGILQKKKNSVAYWC